MSEAVRVRRMEPADVEAVVAVARSLPQWFTESGVANMTVDLANNLGFVAEVEGRIVGFVSWFSYEGVAQISWMGLRPDYHRQGLGRRLLEELERWLRASGARVLRVQTLGDSVDYEPYERTRAFYRRLGFVDFNREETNNPECPEQLTLQKEL